MRPAQRSATHLQLVLHQQLVDEGLRGAGVASAAHASKHERAGKRGASRRRRASEGCSAHRHLCGLAPPRQRILDAFQHCAGAAGGRRTLSALRARTGCVGTRVASRVRVRGGQGSQTHATHARCGCCGEKTPPAGRPFGRTSQPVDGDALKLLQRHLLLRRRAVHGQPRALARHGGGAPPLILLRAHELHGAGVQRRVKTPPLRAASGVTRRTRRA